MPIKKRQPDNPQRMHGERNSKLRHPMLKTGSPHFSIWDTLVNAGAGGLTAAQIKSRNSLYHPQVIKDLMDARLIAVVNQNQNEKQYIADPKGRGRHIQSVRVVVQLLEDESGYFHAVAYVPGQNTQPSGKVRVAHERGINFVVPEITKTHNSEFKSTLRPNEGPVIDGSYVTVITDPSFIIDV